MITEIPSVMSRIYQNIEMVMRVVGVLTYLTQLQCNRKMPSIDEKSYTKYYCLLPMFVIKGNAKFQLEVSENV